MTPTPVDTLGREVVLVERSHDRAMHGSQHWAQVPRVQPRRQGRRLLRGGEEQSFGTSAKVYGGAEDPAGTGIVGPHQERRGEVLMAGEARHASTALVAPSPEHEEGGKQASGAGSRSGLPPLPWTHRWRRRVRGMTRTRRSRSECPCPGALARRGPRTCDRGWGGGGDEVKYGLAIGDFFLAIIERTSRWRWAVPTQSPARRASARRRPSSLKLHGSRGAGRSGVETTDE